MQDHASARVDGLIDVSDLKACDPQDNEDDRALDRTLSRLAAATLSGNDEQVARWGACL